MGDEIQTLNNKKLESQEHFFKLLCYSFPVAQFAVLRSSTKMSRKKLKKCPLCRQRLNPQRMLKNLLFRCFQLQQLIKEESFWEKG